jgi:hypothetical protein
VLTLLKRTQAFFSEHREQFDVARYLREILEMEVVPQAKQKEIVACFPETQPASSAEPPSLTAKWPDKTMERKLLCFPNTWVSSRKQAAKSLQQRAGQEVSSYIDEQILSPWRHFTLSLTTNVSERFNRKIEQCVSGRYGIASVESTQVLLRGLWLKQVLLNGHRHRAQTTEVASINGPRICQEYLDPGKILHVFHDYESSQVEKLA